MNPDEPVSINYQQFCDFVRRFDQVAMLKEVAKIALRFEEDPNEQKWLHYPPWALAGIVKASICTGNPCRKKVPSENDVALACNMFHNIYEEEDGEAKSAFNTFLRIAYEQFPYQESVFEEVSRAHALFLGYSGEKPLEVLSPANVTELLGAPLAQVTRVLFLLLASATANAGVFNFRWLDQPNLREIVEILPKEEVLSVIDAVFAASFDQFRVAAVRSGQRPNRYSFNTLTARPLVKLPNGQYLAPVPQLLARRLSPLEHYYSGLEKWGEPFTKDLGTLYEDYVGRQLRQLPNSKVIPEIKYRHQKNDMLSVDWIVVFEEMVLLVEAKATRVSAPTRAADDSARDTFRRILGKAFDQIEKTAKAIREGRPEFQGIPTDRPLLGFVTTLDSWYFGNTELARDFLPKPTIPTGVASARELEELVTIGLTTPAPSILTGIAERGEETWHLSTALRDHRNREGRNPILQEAWSHYSFGQDDV